MDMVPMLTRLVPRAAQPGSHRSGSSSVSSLLSTLVPTLLFAIVLIVGFLCLRTKQRRVYAPRTYHHGLRKDERTPRSTKQGMFGWIGEFRRLPDEYVLNHQSLDQYLFLRFLKMITTMCFVGCCITWPILLPVNGTGGGGESGLDTISISNIENPNRYYAHVIVAWMFFAFVMFMITRETIYSINIRHAFLVSPAHASRISAKTVLFTDVSESSMKCIRRTFDAVERIWIATDCTELQKLIDDRDDTMLKLENAEIKLSQQANKRHLKAKSTSKEPHDRDGSGPEGIHELDDKNRPSHRLKPIIGKKVDTIDWARGKLPKLIERIKNTQSRYQHHDEGKFIGAVFIEFRSQRAAYTAFQLIPHQRPLQMQARCIDEPPGQIIWKNLGMKFRKRIVRGYLATGLISLMILFWSLPVALVGTLSNINYLTDEVPFLSFIDNIPKPILGVITGLLPTILLAVLVILVPVLCRMLAKFAGAVTLAEVELKTQTWYFAFQFIQVFLITTFTSGAAAVAAQIAQSPTSAPRLLAKNLPKASNFYISYFILYGLAMSSKALFNVVALLKLKVLGRFLDKSPRKMFNRYNTLSGLKWGSEYPKWTNLAVIAIAYSCIAPIVLGFATLGLGLLYLAYRYNSFFTVITTVDTNGKAYSRALQQLTAGVYLAELCLIGLFAINTGTSISSCGPLILMVVLLVGTAVYHITMHKILHPLTRTLPSSLFTETDEFETQYILENGQGVNGQGPDGRNPLSGRGGRMADTAPRGNVKKHGNLLSRFFNPGKHCSYNTLKDQILPTEQKDTIAVYPEELKRDAYSNPAITSKGSKLWIVKDAMGISAREVRDTGKIVLITDDHAWFNDKGKIAWDKKHPYQAPIWDEEMRKRLI